MNFRAQWLLATLVFSVTAVASDLQVGRGPGETPHVVLMQYEPWFGRHAHNDWSRPAGFDGFSILPILKSAGFERVIHHVNHWGEETAFTVNGYDSSDPAVLRQHFAWLEAMGVDALYVDFSNRVAHYNSDYTVGPEYTMFQNIRAIYRELGRARSKLKVVPMLGAYLPEDVESGGLLDLMNDWYRLMTVEEPGHNIIYEGRPLIAIFHAVGTEVDSCGTKSCWQATRELLKKNRPRSAARGSWFDATTIRHVGGMYDAQTGTQGPFTSDAFEIKNQRDPDVKFWTWVDRFKPSKGYFPSFARDASGVIEAFTAAGGSGGTAGVPSKEKEQREQCYPTRRGGLSCAWGRYPQFAGDKAFYQDDATLRVEDDVFTLTRYLKLAAELKPTFLIVGQWNQFEQTDEGFDYLTTHSLEPASFGGGIDPFTPYNEAKREILNYREVVAGRAPAQVGLKNISLRGLSGTGERTLIGGFHVEDGLKRVLVRGVGPTLKKFGLTKVNLNPNLELYAGAKSIAQNDNWRSEPSNHEVELTKSNWGHTPDANEAALTKTLKPGSYSVLLGGPTAVGQVALLEIADADTIGTRLTAISGRAYVGAGDDLLISGFVVTGQKRRILLRGSGPSLAQFGIKGYLNDPQIELYEGARKLRSGDDWGQESNAAKIAGTASNGAFPLDKKDAAILLELEPGSYTVHLLGVNNGTGVGHIEVSDLGPAE